MKDQEEKVAKVIARIIRRAVSRRTRMLSERLASAERDLEEYRMRLAGALTTVEGHMLDVQDREDTAPYLRTCPTIAACVQVRRERDALAAQAERDTATIRRLNAQRNALQTEAADNMARADAAEARAGLVHVDDGQGWRRES